VEGIEITKIVGNVDHLQVHGDIVDFYGVSVSPEDITYSPNSLNIGGLVLQVENGRFAFAQALQMFTEPDPYFQNKYQLIGGPGFGYVRHKGQLIRIKHFGKVEIGKNVEIHNFVNIDRGTIGSTVIGDNCKIDSFCHIAHNVHLGKSNTLAAHTIIEGSCEIGDNNTFGTGVIVLRKVKIGNNNLFGSGCVVTKDIGDNGVYVGNPARKLRDNEAEGI
jgi:acetyltransferase-like isoleucine patch superfamily enzyme